MYKGIGASSGIAIGTAFVLPSWEWEIPEKDIDVSEMAFEFQRLYDGIRTSKIEIHTIRNEIADFIGKEESTIFDAHLAILEDPVFMHEIQNLIQRQFKGAEIAVKEVIDKFVNMFDLLDDEYMKERALDIKDVGNRLLKHLLGATDIPLPSDGIPYILVSKELSPSQLAHLNPEHLLGIVTMLGGTTSHSSIMARAMGIPFVLGLEGKLSRPIQTGDSLIIDGDEGIVYVEPNMETLHQYHLLRAKLKLSRESLQKIAELPTVTLDGVPISLSANISSVKELDQALQNGAAGVGLFRTEFLYMDRTTLPKEDEQFDVYKEVAEKLKGKPVIIRTLDIGGDKQLDYFSLPTEDNPFLGYRAIRISLDRKDLFKTQLKAILRASFYGNVKIMYPMISSIEEVREANDVLEKAKKELRADHHYFNEAIEVGIMIEVPAAAAIADILACEVDFFSIGTNDLIQYVLAVDRMNEKIAHLYEPFHPAVIRLLQLTIDAAKREGIPVGVCGELAGDIAALPIWIGLGVSELSMSVQSILKVKERVLVHHKRDSEILLNKIMKCSTSREIKELLEEKLQS